MPCPHFKVTITKRSDNKSAVAGAAYQSGENLHSDYDDKMKRYKYKTPEVVHKEIMLPEHAPPEYADRATLWNAVEAVENQWNSQLARRFVLCFPVEVPPEQYLQMLREYCQEQFVSKGMIVDFAIHDKGDGNPHAHIMLTMRGFDENGKWLPKCRKEYVLDETGQRIKLPSGQWKSRRVNLNDWNDKGNVEKWRTAWADIENKYLEMNGRPERADLRSYARQGIDQIPTVHMGPEAFNMEKRGIRTDVGDLNREIKQTNSLMASIRNMIRTMKNWIGEMMQRRAELKSIISDRQNNSVINYLYKYLEMREAERTDWSGTAQFKSTVKDYEKVMRCIEILKQKDIFTFAELNDHLSELEHTSAFHNQRLKNNEKRYATIQSIYDRYETYKKLKPVFEAYSRKNFKFTKEKFYAEHKAEIDEYRKAVRFLKANHGSVDVKKGEYAEEIRNRNLQDAESQDVLAGIKDEISELRRIRFFVNQVLEKEKPAPAPVREEKSGIHDRLKGAKDKADDYNQQRKVPQQDKTKKMKSHDIDI